MDLGLAGQIIETGLFRQPPIQSRSMPSGRDAVGFRFCRSDYRDGIIPLASNTFRFGRSDHRAWLIPATSNTVSEYA
jgi:hypothetical protein